MASTSFGLRHTPTQLNSFPEELLERILSLCVVSSPDSHFRLLWLQFGAPSPLNSEKPSQNTCIRGRLAPLLVCKRFLRISIPLFYHTVHISSPRQLNNLLENALRINTCFPAQIRHLVFDGVWAHGGEVMRLCGEHLRTLDIMLDAGPAFPVTVEEGQKFCEGLRHLTVVTHMVLRKSTNVYLTHHKARYVIGEIAKAIENWEALESIDIAFRLSDDCMNHVPFGTQAGPVTALTRALSKRPHLRTFTTVLPSVWNEAILRVSENGALEKIVLCDTSKPSLYKMPPRSSTINPSPVPGVLGTGLFLTQAKKHARLSELIRAGTSIVRTRANTIGTGPYTPNFQPPGEAPFAPTSPHASQTSSAGVKSTTCTSARSPLSANQAESSSSSMHDSNRRHPSINIPKSRRPRPASSFFG